MRCRCIPLFSAAAAMFISASASVAGGPAEVRVLHASPDAPAVDVLVNGGGVGPLSNLSFREVSPYVALPGGTYNVQVVGAGTMGPAVINADLTLGGGVDYTVAAVNVLSAIEPLVLIDDNSIAPGQARVRFVHASPDAPAVDIAVSGGPVIFSNISFRGFSDYLTLAPGTYDLEVRPAGQGVSVLDLPGVTIGGDAVYSVFATGLLSGSPSLGALITVDAVPAPGAAGLLGAAGVLALRRRRR